jgi:hypothetical protein
MTFSLSGMFRKRDGIVRHAEQVVDGKQRKTTAAIEWILGGMFCYHRELFRRFTHDPGNVVNDAA